jgi:hypothetical protein
MPFLYHLDVGNNAFLGTLAKSNDADIMLFSDNAKYVSLNTRDSTLILAKWLASQCASAGSSKYSSTNRN